MAWSCISCLIYRRVMYINGILKIQDSSNKFNVFVIGKKLSTWEILLHTRLTDVRNDSILTKWDKRKNIANNYCVI